MMTFGLGLQLLLMLAVTSHAFEINNRVVGKPEVFCGIDTIRVKVNTDHPFRGRVYVDGESDKQHCVQRSEQTHSTQEFSIPIGACNMRRQRTLHPRGIAFSFTMIVSFHPFFVTGMDRAFSIRCFFLESIKGLNAEINVGTLAPQSIDQEYSLPVCAYHLKDSVEGHVLRFAQVGQKVTHVWRCDQDASHVYGILIHSCYADDGRGNKFELVDDRGCSTDPFLLPQIEYESGAISAYTNAHVFKYADKVQLYFTCTVQLCYKHDGGCEGITPPVCGGDGGGGGDTHHPSPSAPFESQHPPQSPPPPPFVHLRQPPIFGNTPNNVESNQFQPVIIGPPHPSVFADKAPPPPPHHVPPFKGPHNLIDDNDDETPDRLKDGQEEEQSAYRRDSPLNETDEDIVLRVVSLRTTLPTPLSLASTTAELVTFKPVASSSSSSAPLPSTTKVRRTAGEMETDVSVDVIVLPVEEQQSPRGGKDSPPQSLGFSGSADVCMSRGSTAVTLVAIAMALVGVGLVTFLVTRQRIRLASLHHAKHRIDNY